MTGVARPPLMPCALCGKSEAEHFSVRLSSFDPDHEFKPKKKGSASVVEIDGRSVPVVIDSECPHEGVVEWDSDFLNEPTRPKRIVLRHWNERVLLHETIHCLIGDNEALTRRLTKLHDLGWRRYPDV